MRRFFVRHKFLMKLCAVTLLLAIFCGVFLIMGWGSLLHRVGNTVIYPFQWVFSKVGDGIGGFVMHFEDVDRLQEKIDALELENESLRAELSDAEILYDEQAWLYRYLSMKEEHIDYQMCAARVISASGEGSGGFETLLTLNKGSAQGIQKGMPVVSTSGLVGMVVEVGINQCYVQTILKPTSSVGALSPESSDKGLLEGDFAYLYQGQAVLKYLPEDAEIKEGDAVITSGNGSVYPYGIPIGKVAEVSVNPHSRTKEAIVTPFHDFSDTKEVMILTSYIRYTEGDHTPESEGGA